MVQGETDPSKMCSFMHYCAAAQKTIDSSYKFIYKCTQCVGTVNGGTRVAQFVGRDNGKLWSDATNVDSYPQCLPQTSLTSAVSNCYVYKQKPLVTTSGS
jgi:hypothetical protein